MHTYINTGILTILKLIHTYIHICCISIQVCFSRPRCTEHWLQNTPPIITFKEGVPTLPAYPQFVKNYTHTTKKQKRREQLASNLFINPRHIPSFSLLAGPRK